MADAAGHSRIVDFPLKKGFEQLSAFHSAMAGFFQKTMFCDSLPRPALRVPHVALHGLPHLRGIRQIANRHRAPATMRYSDPGIVPFGRLSQ
jgi:hypothetical protein